MARLPKPGSDTGTWGTILNQFLEVSHNSDGSLKSSAVTAAGAGTYSKPSGGIPATDLSSSVQSSLAAANTAVQIGGDIDGAATNPTVVKLRGVSTPSVAPSGAGQVLTSTSTSATAWSTLANAPVTSVAGRTGAVTLAESDITNLTTDLATTEKTANKGAVSGYAPLNGSSQVPIANIPTGTSSTTVAIGNDIRITGAVQSSTAAAKGDLLAATAASTIARLGVGSDGQVLTADATQSTGIKWGTPASSPGNATNSTPGLIQLTGDLGNSATSPQVTSTHLASALPINQGGTGQTSKSAAFNALSPNAALGDITYGSGTNTSTNLAGNTSATKNYLTQTGTGSASAPPAWGTIAAADLPAATTSTQGVIILNDTQAAATSGFTSLVSLMAAIANRDNARCDIAVIGDSITEGNGATAFASRYITQATKAIRQKHPTTANLATGGLGFIPIQKTGETTYTWPVTLASGTAGNIDVGPVRFAAAPSGTTSWTWVAPTGTTSVKIMYYNSYVAGVFSWKINSGSTTNVSNTASFPGVDGALTGSITITSGQTLTIAYVSGSPFPEGIIHYAGDETSGITFHGLGHFGWNAGTGSSGWMQTGSALDWRPAVAALATGAVGIMLGINDASTSAGNETAATFQTNVTALITYLRGNSTLANLPVLLIIPYQPNETFTDSGGWAAYVAALRAIQAATTNTWCIDLNYRMPTVASGFGGGELYSDTVHPTNLGHALAGEIVAAGVTIV